MKNILSSIFVVLFLFIIQIQGEEISKVGTSAAGFLQMETGARGVAMGGSLVANASDASAVYWNPAAAGISNKFNSYYEQTQMYADIQKYNIGITYPINSNNAVAILVNYLNLGTMDVTTVLEPEGTGNTFDAASYYLAIAYSRALTNRVRVGLTFKKFEERIWLEKAGGFAFDLGTLYNFGTQGIRVGMNLSNLGSTTAMDEGPHLNFYQENSEDFPGEPQPASTLLTQSFQLPLTFTMGISLDVIGENGILQTSNNQTIILNISANDGFDLPFRMNAGIEYSYYNYGSLRMGWHQNYDMAGLSFGGGIHIPVPGNGVWIIDYAWVDYADLGALTLWSLAYEF